MIKRLGILLLLIAVPSIAFAQSQSPLATAAQTWPVNAQTANYTLALSDQSHLISMKASGNTTLTIPLNASVAFPIGTTIRVQNPGAYPAGSNLLTITPTSGVTVTTRGSLTLTSYRDDWILTKTGTDSWTLSGNQASLVNSDYALTTTDGSGSLNQGIGVNQFWGNGTGGVSCGASAATSSRLVTTATGGPTNGPYRQFNVVSGDNFGGFGMRCQVGSLEWRFGDGYNALWTLYNSGYVVTPGTFALFREGQHRITDFDVQLESSFTLSSNAGFQLVAQWKQSPPNTSAQNSGSPVLELDARNSLWQFISTQGAAATATLWSTAATLSTWYHIRTDCNYSQFTTLGWCQVIVTPWSGGVLGTPVYSPLLTGIQTLAIETGTSDLLPVGTSIPSSLAVGPYVRTGSPTEAVDMTNFEVWDAS